MAGGGLLWDSWIDREADDSRGRRSFIHNGPKYPQEVQAKNLLDIVLEITSGKQLLGNGRYRLP